MASGFAVPGKWSWWGLCCRVARARVCVCACGGRKFFFQVAAGPASSEAGGDSAAPGTQHRAGARGELAAAVVSLGVEVVGHRRISHGGEAVGVIAQPDGGILLHKGEAGGGGGGGGTARCGGDRPHDGLVAGQRRRRRGQELVARRLDELELVEVEAVAGAEARRAVQQGGLGAAQIEAAGAAGAEGAAGVEVVEAGAHELLHLGYVARCGRRQRGGLLGPVELVAAVALRLAVARGGEVLGRPAGAEVEVVVAPVDRRGAQAGAEQTLVLFRHGAVQVEAVGHVGRVLDAGEVQRQAVAQLAEGARAVREGR